MIKKYFISLFSFVFVVFGSVGITFADDLNANLIKENSNSNEISAINQQMSNPDETFGENVVTSGTMQMNNHSSSDNNDSIQTFAQGPVTTVAYHTSEALSGNKFRVKFWIDSVSGPAPITVSAQIQLLSEPTLKGPVTVANSKIITKTGNIKKGLLGYADFPAKTSFVSQGGAYGMVLAGGNAGTWPIKNSGIYLWNKKSQNFPQYVDAKSHKNAEASIQTNWKKLSVSPGWTGKDRSNFIAQYSRLYGNQSATFWKSNQVHHIRPRIYGGTNSFSNLMPVPIAKHKLITSWFVNY